MTFLESVMEDKRREVTEKRSRVPLESLLGEIATDRARDFRASISSGTGIIAELKARTPSIASFRHSHALESLAETYAECGASAISIVTDEKRFGTSLAMVRRVRQLTNLPVLVKDFVYDPYQVIEARAHGADAILLIVRILDWDSLVALLDLARELQMSALVETHNESEVKTALQARAEVIGINNRDLDTMDVSLDTTRRLAALIPEGVLAVAESGIRNRKDIDDLAACGVGAYLIGGSLLDAEKPCAKLSELTGKQS